jgi:phosphonate degradation associated HDIG domain protein
MTAEPRWPLSSPASATEVADNILALFVARGDNNYDEAVTQTQHAMQSAALAEAESAEDSMTIAALLHDLGHLLVDEHNGNIDFLGSDENHQFVGANLLGRWFPPAVTVPIALHVAAKRYLVATEPAYAHGLSDASVKSLRVQGGPMNAQELARFRRVRYADEACRLRRWDDAAKVPNRVVPQLDHYREHLESLVVFMR